MKRNIAFADTSNSRQSRQTSGRYTISLGGIESVAPTQHAGKMLRDIPEDYR